MFTQGDEENFILSYFARSGLDFGRFLDIGASDGHYLSSTRALFHKGWGGVLVEPAPIPFAGLFKMYDGSPKVQVLNCAVSLKSEIIPFYLASVNAVSTTKTEHRDYWAGKNVRYGTYWLKTVTVDEILDQFGTDFDFVKIDIEGADLELLKPFPITRLPMLKMLCIECVKNENELRAIVSPWGFAPYHKTKYNLLLTRNM